MNAFVSDEDIQVGLPSAVARGLVQELLIASSEWDLAAVEDEAEKDHEEIFLEALQALHDHIATLEANQRTHHRAVDHAIAGIYFGER